MLNLSQMLLDFDTVHLRVIAGLRGIELVSHAHDEIVATLSGALLDPAIVEEGLRRLSPEEREALEALQLADGQMRAHVFFHQFGPIRRLGPGRLERERPWETPAGPAESLWYKGFIGRRFAIAEDGTPEIIFIPKDLLTLLPSPTRRPEPEPEEKAGTDVILPARVHAEGYHAVEDLFQLLLYIQLHRPRAVAQEHIGVHDVSRLNERLSRPEPTEGIEHDGQTSRLALIHHLARRLGLIQREGPRLRLAPEPTRAWLSMPITLQQRSLLDMWKQDDSWNDLWHVPSIRCEPAGWENDPRRTRARFLLQLASQPAGVWLSIPAFIQRVKSSDPDFQRPDGDYRSWYIRDTGNDELLIGFEQWERVEGALIQYYLQGPLYWLGVVDLGYRSEGYLQASAFRITDIGARFIAGSPEPSLEISKPPLTLHEGLIIELAGDAPLYYRFQLERFAERAAGERTYHITSRSLLTARAQHIRPADIVRFLTKCLGAPVPTAAEEELRRRWHSVNIVRARRLIALEFSEPAVVEWLQGDVEAASFFTSVIAPQRVLVSERQLPRLLARLRQLGLEPEIVQEE